MFIHHSLLRGLSQLGPVFLVPLFVGACSPSNSSSPHAPTNKAAQVVEIQMKEEDRARLQLLEQEFPERVKELNELREKVTLLEKERRKAEDDFSIFRARYHSEDRFKASDKAIGTLEVQGGKIYQAVVIREVAEDGLHISHQNGAANIPFTQIDPQWLESFDASAKSENKSAEKSSLETAQTSNQQDFGKATILKTPDPAQKTAEKEIARLRQELRNEIKSIFAGMKTHRQEHYKETNTYDSGNYIKLSSWNESLQENRYGGKKPGMIIDLDSDYNDQFPENSACLDANTFSGIFGKAKNLRTQIITLKSQTP